MVPVGLERTDRNMIARLCPKLAAATTGSAPPRVTTRIGVRIG